MLQTINEYYNKIIVLFVQIGFIASIMGGVKIIISTFVLTNSVYFTPILLGFLAATPIYILDRVKYISEDLKSEAKKERINIVQNYKNILILISVISYVLYLSIGLYYVNIFEMIVINIQVFVFIMYPHLKNYLVLDTISIALVNATLFVTIPLFVLDLSFSTNIIWLFIIGFIMKFSETELSNIRDMSADKKSGHITLPVRYDIRKLNILILSGEIISLIILALIIDILIIQVFIILIIFCYIKLEYDVSNKNISEVMLYNRLLKILISIFIFFYVYMMI